MKSGNVTQVKRRAIVISRGVKLVAAVLLGVPLAFCWIAPVVADGTWDPVLAGLATVTFGLPLLWTWTRPSPGSRRAYKVVRVHPVDESSSSEKTRRDPYKGDPFHDPDAPDAIWCHPDWSGVPGNLYHSDD